jgi:hypothetical protein
MQKHVCPAYSSGNLSFRTERYVEQVALSFGLQTFLKIYPASATLSFYGSATVLAMETYNFRATSGLSAFKLTALDELCFDIVTSANPDFEDADRRLHAKRAMVMVKPGNNQAIDPNTCPNTQLLVL